MSSKIVIIGSSIAGVSAAEGARKQDPDAEIIILSTDTYMPYYRLRICEILNDPDLAKKLYLHPDSWYHDRRIEIRLNQTVIAIDSVRRLLLLANGQSETYTRLVIASGSQNFVPAIQGVNRPGVHALWTMTDALTVAAELGQSQNVLVIGGGLLGLEAAYFARKAGRSVTIIERNNRLLANQLDEAGSAVFLSRVEALGVDVKTSAEVVTIEGQTAAFDSRVQRAIMSDGRVIVCDLVLLCIGVRARIGFLDGSGISVQRRVSANAKMETTMEGVYTAGDAAEPDGYWFGLWSVSKAQGLVAGTNAAGGDLTFDKVVPPYVINTMETKIVVQGDKGVMSEAHYDLDALLDEENCTYRKLIYRDGIFSGFILIGDTSDFVKLQKSIGHKPHT